jgi:hypothetical protein
MAMAFTAEGKNLMLAAMKGTNPTTPITHAAVFNGDPSGSGSQVGDRETISFGTPSSGSMEDSGDVVFTVPSSSTINYVAFYSASTGGVLLAYDDVAEEVFNEAGEYTLTQAILHLNA